MSFISPKAGSGRAIPLGAIVLLALAIHGPLLLMQLPQSSYDANTHMFFASHYASHWFDPWNVKWYGGFSQTTYPPLVHQWIALFSHVVGITMAYMFVQLCTILLLVVGMYRYARLWVDERAASYAAIGSVFLGSLAMLVYQSGQLPTTCSAALTLNALPYFYEWATRSRFGSFIKGILIALAAAAAHHVTFLFGMILFALPILWLAILDRRRGSADTSAGAVVVRSAIFAILAIVGVGLVLLPYWIALLQNPIKQTPIPHGSRDNYILNPGSGMNFWIIPMGALLIAFPFIFFKGASERRLRPLLVGWFVTLLLGLGGTTPVARVLLGRAYEILTFERFTFWQTLMALPIVALLAAAIIDRYQRRGAVVLWVLAAFTCSMAVAWTVFRPITASPFQIDPVVTFLNRDDHSKFRYLTLGFGTQFSRVSMLARADSIDGNYHSARMLPEMTQYGSGDLDASKYFGTAGMESLRAILKHANKYGVKYAFVRDRYYEPLLAFAGWRQAEVYDNGNITLWSKDDVPPAQPVESPYRPAPWIGLWWGIFPIASSILAIIFVLMIPDRRPVAETVEFPAEAGEPVVLREAK